MSGLLLKLLRSAQIVELTGGRSERRVALNESSSLRILLTRATRAELRELRRAGVGRVRGQFAPPDHVITLALP